MEGNLNLEICCVTSMNDNYYNRIGKLMIKSWSQRWFTDSQLVIYNEGAKIPIPNKNILIKDWFQCCESDWNEFVKKTESIPVKKFAKKGFAFLHALQNINCDLLIWIDADILFYQNVNENEIVNILPSNKLIAFFDTYYQQNPNYTQEDYMNPNRPITAAESGFVLVNKNHKDFDMFVKNYKDYYSADDKPSFLGNWYDGNICAAAAFEFRNDVIDMSKFRTTNKTQTPLNKSWLGKYFRHQKGNVKNKINLAEKEKQLGLHNE